jgi:hypothetical protein
MDIFDRYKNDKDFVLATHIFANVAHFRKLLDEFPWDSQSDWVQWGLLEATLVKARAIADFLITDSQNRKKDFGAKSMIPTWIQFESEFIKLRELVNKQVAHFAQQRFIGGLDEAAISDESLIAALRSVDVVFSRFEVELSAHNSDLSDELTRHFLHF